MKTDRLPRILPALLLFFIVDLTLFFTFGVLFLNGMEFTSLKVLSSSAGSAYFSWKDYFFNCTVPCLLEDIAISIIYYVRLIKEPQVKRKKTEVVYLWFVHVNIKILLNVHSTGLFLSALEYSRVSGWETFDLRDEAYFTDSACFAEQRSSLLLSLLVLVITFFLVSFYNYWTEYPNFCFFIFLTDIYMFPLFSASASTSHKLLGAVLGGVLFLAFKFRKKLLGGLQKIFEFLTRKLPTAENPYQKYVRYASIGFFLFTTAWIIVRTFIVRSDNMNSLFGIQYSALLKFLTPIFLLVNLVTKKTSEKDYPLSDTAKQHTSSNQYACNTLLMVMIGCLALMYFGEFGSIICILSLTVVMMLLFVDIPDIMDNCGNNKSRFILKAVQALLVSLVSGIVIGLIVIASENMFLQLLLRSIGLELGGRIGNLALDSFGVIFAGIVCALLLVVILGLGICSLFIPSISYFYGFLEWCQHTVSNKLARIIGKAAFRRPREHIEQRVHTFNRNVSIACVLATAVVLVLHFNFFLHAYDNTTILRRYYLTAGNFDNESEITENITQIRTAEVKAAEKGEAAQASENIPEGIKDYVKSHYPEKAISSCKEYEEVKALKDLPYHHEVYSNRLLLKMMHIIDRLCYSSRTAELSAVQRGLKRNMGFDTRTAKEHVTYISSLQKKYFVTLDDVLSSEKAQEIYPTDETQESEFMYLNFKGEKPKDGQTKYLCYKGDVEKFFTVIFQDGSKETILASVQENQRIFKRAEPSTASSDYILYTLSRMGVGNVLLLVLMPYFSMITILLFTDTGTALEDYSREGRIRYILYHLGSLYAVSFVIQTMVIVCGVFGVSLFSGLSLPMVAAGNFEMLMNSICMAIFLIAVGDPNRAERGSASYAGS